MSKSKTAAARIRAYKKKFPTASAKDIALAIGTSLANVYAALKPKPPEKVLLLAGGPTEEELKAPDNVNHPAHYKVGGIETIDFIEAKKLGYNLGNVVKYLTRADHKGNKLEDLRKAQWYLCREINALK